MVPRWSSAEKTSLVHARGLIGHHAYYRCDRDYRTKKRSLSKRAACDPLARGTSLFPEPYAMFPAECGGLNLMSRDSLALIESVKPKVASFLQGLDYVAFLGCRWSRYSPGAMPTSRRNTSYKR